MVDKIAEFRRVAAGKRKEGRRARYGDGMRRYALAHAKARMSAGASVQRVAAELGLTGQTLSNWLHAEGQMSERPARLMAVSVKQEKREPLRTPIVLVAGDVRVEVSDVETAAELVRRLQ